MINERVTLLADRGVVTLTGPDAIKLLGGIVTNDLAGVENTAPGRLPAVFAGLLSPQGKILFDFIVVADNGRLLLDIARDKAAECAKRLTLYKLRAKVDIQDVSDTHVVQAVWGPQPASSGRVPYADPRSAGLGIRLISREFATDDASATNGMNARPEAYHAHRIALGIPEGGKDYDFGDAFPHEANFDLLHGVAFDKGCYVGQEIVARMEHRGTVRKRIVRVSGAADLPATRPEIRFGDVVIGKLGSVAGRQGLGLVRLDRAIEAIDKGIAITADGIALEVDVEMIERQRKLMADKAAAP